jgi:hypothetical protein
MKLIYIEWEDARSNHNWLDEEEVKEYFNRSTMVRQVGWVYKEDKHCICIISRVSDFQYNGSDDIAYGNVIKIPKGWIHKRINLSIKKRTLNASKKKTTQARTPKPT